MSKALFALKDDVDMLTIQVQQLASRNTTIDWMAQKMKKFDEELTCQGEQMRRMEDDIKGIKSIKKILVLICQKLNINPTL